MKRDGRTVVTYTILPYPQNPRPAARILSKLGSGAPVAGIFVKFAGSRSSDDDCPNNPAGKSRNKCKGTQKSRASEAALNYKRANWRVMSPDLLPGSGKLASGSGRSATRMLDELAARDKCDEDDHDDDSDHGSGDDYGSDGYGH